jgi:hypothetical protein
MILKGDETHYDLDVELDENNSGFVITRDCDWDASPTRIYLSTAQMVHLVDFINLVRKVQPQ